jgi:hypothetical protein
MLTSCCTRSRPILGAALGDIGRSFRHRCRYRDADSRELLRQASDTYGAGWRIGNIDDCDRERPKITPHVDVRRDRCDLAASASMRSTSRQDQQLDDRPRRSHRGTPLRYCCRTDAITATASQI